ncbi:DeoR/GlpR family DNA-binding transcription regulator [Endozoicomonas sp. SCSIO W0465]|uniref:DeoR/GlpR family DNA-binding transcription regulator n=1 Tax=Endozoicomonas sp. SCSIO W0465 TaxID=2918516 RepID=UPI002075A01E|nr:DeoR/GlpR family DNA-binding transcription regulator [Endozoicomonas sp. SCSIO W0465]USE35825.1 DeoR/GlpR family DNA-binding transcription regulator [Endozoicomonas sp. SCSIO W0465]
MLPVERREHILAFVEEKGCANIEEMAERFDVSQMTIRRDIRTLEQEDKLRVTYGGAVSKSFLMEDIPYEKKNAVNIEEKKSIAHEALKQIREGQIVLLDSGTSTMALAKLMMRMKVTVITTDLKIALQLSDSSTVKVFTTGGNVSAITKAHTDVAALSFLDSINADIAFLATNSWSLNNGVTTASNDHYYIRRKMMERANKTVLLADSSKFGASSMKTIAHLEELDCIITDSKFDEDNLAAIREAGGNIILPS